MPPHLQAQVRGQCSRSCSCTPVPAGLCLSLNVVSRLLHSVLRSGVWSHVALLARLATSLLSVAAAEWSQLLSLLAVTRCDQWDTVNGCWGSRAGPEGAQQTLGSHPRRLHPQPGPWRRGSGSRSGRALCVPWSEGHAH